MNHQLTERTCVIDNFRSMQSIASDAVGGYKLYLLNDIRPINQYINT